ncbi:hypothetical protein COE30_12965 [Bacillus cereus]|uniref:DUF3916 domain-containing protein n=1 Tax=Bacillus cereus TaxID=1396 RepID=UPI000BFB9DF4|nr:DUF3916 domain-containing protein [Bacillus cereus]PGZ08405.1 hypothetical protein COE30_12965 [Bacillus cereus]
MRIKKIRGLKRRCRTFLKCITEDTNSLPNYHDHSDLGSWHLYLPFNKFFIDYMNTPNSVKKFFIQTAINRVQYLIDIKTETEKEYRIYFVISMPNLQVSNILVLFSKRGIERFWEGFLGRDMKEQSFYSLPQDDNIRAKLGLYIPKGLDIRGYKEVVGSYNYPPEEEVWFVGELN